MVAADVRLARQDNGVILARMNVWAQLVVECEHDDKQADKPATFVVTTLQPQKCYCVVLKVRHMPGHSGDKCLECSIFSLIFIQS